MEKILTEFSLTEILLCVFLIALAVKEVWNLVDYFKDKIKHKQTEDAVENEEKKNTEKQFNDIEDKIDSIDTILKKEQKEAEKWRAKIEFKLDDYKTQLDILIASDKDDIKGYIVEKYHYFTKQGWIDDFNRDVLEKRYSHYVDEGGNSYIKDLMNKIRVLPTTPPQK